jgi:DNA-binding transcriptional LysR family regulator
MPRTTIDWESRIGRRLGVRDLHVFVTVVQCGSMAKAARELNVTQPAVSKAIGDLEHTLGVRLLDRRPQGVELTIYGRALLKRSNAVFDELKQSVRDIEFLADPTVGEVRFGCHDSIAAAALPPIMDRFSKQYPRVALHMEVIGVVGDRPELPSLHQRLIDFAIFRLSTPLSDQQITDELHVEILFNDQLVVAAGRHSPWARRRKIDLAELMTEPWILSAPHTWNYVELAAACRARGIDMPKTRLDTVSTAVRINLLGAGPYIATFPSSSMRLFADRFSLAVLPVELPTRPWPVALITLKNRTLSPVVERFLDCTREVAKSFSNRPRLHRH